MSTASTAGIAELPVTSGRGNLQDLLNKQVVTLSAI